MLGKKQCGILDSDFGCKSRVQYKSSFPKLLSALPSHYYFGNREYSGQKKVKKKKIKLNFILLYFILFYFIYYSIHQYVIYMDNSKKKEQKGISKNIKL